MGRILDEEVDAWYNEEKYEISEKMLYEKNLIRLSRHSSFMIMHIFADWGNTGQNMAESLGITTVSTTKAHGWNRDKCKGVGMIP